MMVPDDPPTPAGALAAWGDRLRQRRGNPGIAHTLARGALWSLVIVAGGSAISFGVQVLLTRSLGLVDYGHYVYTLGWMNAALLIAKLELDTAALRFVGMYVGARQWSLLRGFLARSHQIVGAASLAVTLLGSIVVWALRDRFPHPLVVSYWMACVLLPVTALLQFVASCLQGFKRVRESQAPNMVMRPLLYGALLALATHVFHVNLTAPVAIALNVVATTVALLVTARFLVAVIPADALRAEPAYDTRTWLQTALGLLVIAAAQLVLATQADVLVVGTLLGTTEAGLYGVASQLAVLISFGVSALIFIALPMIADLHARARRAELQQLVTLISRGSIAVSLPVLLVLLVEGRTILGWFGPSFTSAYHVLVVLSGGQFIAATTGILAGFLLTLTGHQRQAAVIVVGSAVLNLALSLGLTSAFGPVGTAAATTTTMFIRSLVLAIYSWKLLRVRLVPWSTTVDDLG
jgi:O-antigen/teichoic acid export membrane protein